MLSVVILARDEGDRIEGAIESVSFADECVVLDSGSRDDTVARAEAAGARVLQTDWPGFVAQTNRGLAAAAGDWILSIDADERVTPALAVAIRAALTNPTAAGFRVARRNYWLGHRLDHGHWYPDRRVRLVRRGSGRWGGEEPHDHLLVEGVIEDLPGDLTHIPYRNLLEHFSTVDRYAGLGAVAARSAGRRSTWIDLIFRPIWHFFRGYLLKQGFRDGVPGLVVAMIGALYTLLKWARTRDPQAVP